MQFLQLLFGVTCFSDPRPEEQNVQTPSNFCLFPIVWKYSKLCNWYILDSFLKIGYSVYCLFCFFVCVAVQCDLSEWSPWGPCMKKNKTCGFKKGNQTRTREPLQLSSPGTSTGAAPPLGCVPETQTQRCTVQKKITCKGKSEKEQHKNVGKWMDRKCLCWKECMKSVIQLQCACLQITDLLIFWSFIIFAHSEKHVNSLLELI